MVDHMEAHDTAGAQHYGRQFAQEALSLGRGKGFGGVVGRASRTFHNFQKLNDALHSDGDFGGSGDSGDSGTTLYHYSPVAPQDFVGSNVNPNTWLTNNDDLSPIMAKKVLTGQSGFGGCNKNGDYRYTVHVPDMSKLRYDGEPYWNTHSYQTRDALPVTEVASYNQNTYQWEPIPDPRW